MHTPTPNPNHPHKFQHSIGTNYNSNKQPVQARYTKRPTVLYICIFFLQPPTLAKYNCLLSYILLQVAAMSLLVAVNTSSVQSMKFTRNLCRIQLGLTIHQQFIHLHLQSKNEHMALYHTEKRKNIDKQNIKKSSMFRVQIEFSSFSNNLISNCSLQHVLKGLELWYYTCGNVQTHHHFQALPNYASIFEHNRQKIASGIMLA